MNLTFVTMALQKLRSNSSQQNPLTCELHQTMFDILDFNRALKVINIILAYENDENNIILHSVHPPPTPHPLLFLLGGGVEPPTKLSKRGAAAL